MSEIPIFKTCPICKEPKLKGQVQHDAVLDGKKVKICEKCVRESGADRLPRKALLE